MKISIITPSYNQGEYIEKTIKSIIDQGYEDLEYIVMDGGSTDNTVEILKKYDDFIAYSQSESDKGQTDAINKGFEKCTGDIVTWLCSDDYYEPGVLNEVAKAFKENERVNLVAGNRRTYGNGIEDTIYYGIINKDTIEETMFHGGYDQPPSFFRKEAWDNIFPLTTSLRVYMDCEMWLRYLVKYGTSKTLHIPKLFAHGLFHIDSKSMNEAVACRKVLNSLYASLGEAIGVDEKLLRNMKELEGVEYQGNWNISQEIDGNRYGVFLKERFGPQFSDISYIYRDVAGYFMSLGSAEAAKKYASEAIKIEPFKLANYRTWFYCWRKS